MDNQQPHNNRVNCSQMEIVSESDLLATIDEVFLTGANNLPVEDVFVNVPPLFPPDVLTVFP